MEILAIDVKKTVELLEQSIGFRWASEGAKRKQDRTLRDYRNLMALVLVLKEVQKIKIMPGETATANDGLIFPLGPDLTVEYVCQ
jgi:hypothetical protein